MKTKMITAIVLLKISDNFAHLCGIIIIPDDTFAHKMCKHDDILHVITTGLHLIITGSRLSIADRRLIITERKDRLYE